jgi:hypothetical protein
MRAVALMILSAVALAACDAPDPASFHHALRSDAMTGTHVNGAVGSGEVDTSNSTAGIEQMQRNGDNNIRNGAGNR